MADTENEAFGRITAALADGEVIDWTALEQSGTLTPEAIRALRVLEGIRRAQTEPLEAAPPADLPLETGYELIEELGHGSSGRVYRAIDRGLSREVALKVLDESVPIGSHARERFIREARMLAAVDHPNVVRIHSIDELDGRVRISLELIRGRTLEEFVHDHGRLAPEEAARIGIDLSRALSAIHKKGLVHRDVKASNVMREDGGRIVLLDFGVARSGAMETDAGPFAGTPLYMAPEQFEGRADIGPRADLFALGVLLYWMVSQEYPFEGASREELRRNVLAGRRKPLSDRRADIAPEFTAIVARATSVREESRFASAGELEEALRVFLSGASKRTAIADVRGVWTVRRSVVLALSLLALVLAVVVAFQHPRGGKRIVFKPEAFMRRGDLVTRLTSGGTVKQRDEIYLEVRTEEPLYVYVFDEDGKGDMYTLFPVPGFEPANPLPSGVNQHLPGRLRGAQQNWVVSTPSGGSETLLLVAAVHPIEEVEALLRTVKAVKPGEPTEYLKLDSQKRASLLRGIGMTKPAAEPPSAHASGPPSSPTLEGIVSDVEFSASSDHVVKLIRLRGED